MPRVLTRKASGTARMERSDFGSYALRVTIGLLREEYGHRFVAFRVSMVVIPGLSKSLVADRR
jgi:hypothetical protein